MLRAPFKSRPSHEDQPAVPSTHPAPDLFTDGDTPSLPSFRTGGPACCEPHSSHARRTKINPPFPPRTQPRTCSRTATRPVLECRILINFQ